MAKIKRLVLQNPVVLRSEKNWPKMNMEFIDINPLIIQHETFREIVEHLVLEIKDKNVDYILAPESRGFLFGAPVAYALNIGLIPVRKEGKMAPSTVEKTFNYSKEYGEGVLELPKLINGDEYSGKRFYLIDDIYATGKTFESIRNNIEELGGILVGEAVVANIINVSNTDKIFSLMDVLEDNN